MTTIANKAITGEELRRRMRKHKQTIAGLSAKMGITQKRIREVLAGGLTSRQTARDWIQAITGRDPWPAAYAALVHQLDHVTTDYRDDLHKHDRATIEAHPAWPFLHFAGETGTHLLHLLPASEYPAIGERVPYLFGTADRAHILNEARGFVAGCQRTNRPIVHYWDGRHLARIDYPQAMKIEEDYASGIRAQWLAERLAATA